MELVVTKSAVTNLVVSDMFINRRFNYYLWSPSDFTGEDYDHRLLWKM